MSEFKKFKLDIAMLPMGGIYTMGVDEMIDAANSICAKITIPMHYKRLLGEKTKEAEDKLKKSVTNSQIVVLEEVS